MHSTVADTISSDDPNAEPAPAEDDVAFLNILDPAFRVDAQEVQRARAIAWYARTPLGYAVLRYDEVVALLRERRLRQGLAERLARQGITDGPLAQWWRVMILNADGDEHLRLRRLVAKAFTPPAVERLRPFMRASANELIDSFVQRGECDFVAAFADRYPGQIICELLGVPAGTERERFAAWANDLGLAFGFEATVHRARIETAVLALSRWAEAQIAERRRHPGPDLISALIVAEESGSQLSGDELRAMVVALVFAGNDTTRNQLGLAMAAFLAYPAQWP